MLCEQIAQGFDTGHLDRERVAAALEFILGSCEATDLLPDEIRDASRIKEAISKYAD